MSFPRRETVAQEGKGLKNDKICITPAWLFVLFIALFV